MQKVIIISNTYQTLETLKKNEYEIEDIKGEKQIIKKEKLRELMSQGLIKVQNYKLDTSHRIIINKDFDIALWNEKARQYK